MKRFCLALFAVSVLLLCVSTSEAQYGRRGYSSRYYQNVYRYGGPAYSVNPYNYDQYYRLKGYMDSYPYRPFSSSYNPTFNNRGNSRYYYSR